MDLRDAVMWELNSAINDIAHTLPLRQEELEAITERLLAIPEIKEALRITRGQIEGIVVVREMTREEVERKFGDTPSHS